MNDKEKLYIRLNKSNNEIQAIIKKGSNASKDHENILDILNKIHFLFIYISEDLQKEFLKNLKHFQHGLYLETSTYHVNMVACVNILSRTVQQLKDEKTFYNLIPTQKYYNKGRKLDIVEDLSDILQTAEKSILFCDEYMDYTLLGIMKNIRADDIKLLLKNPDHKFEVWIESLSQQENKKIQYRKIVRKIIHDRFVLIDDKTIWQIGGSINHSNINGMTITKISSEVNFNEIKNDLEKYWSESK